MLARLVRRVVVPRRLAMPCLRFSTERAAALSTPTALAEQTRATLTPETFRHLQLTVLGDTKPADFDEVALFHLIGDLLVRPNPPDLVLADRLMRKFVLHHPGIDPDGELCTLHLVQLLATRSRESVAAAVDFFQQLVAATTGDAPLVKIAISRFVTDYLWEAVIETHNDVSGLVLYTLCRAHPTHFTSPPVDRLLLELFLPRQNWAAVDQLVADSVQNEQVTVSAIVLDELFHHFLDSDADDSHADPHHRVVALLERWRAAGIPLKGDQVAKALELTFRRALPTDAMLSRLRQLI